MFLILGLFKKWSEGVQDATATFWPGYLVIQKKAVFCLSYLKFEKKKVLVIYFSNTFLVGYSSKADTKNSYLNTKQKLSYFQKETGSFTSNERRKSLKNNFSNFTKIPWKLFSLGRFILVAKKALLLFLLPNWLKAKK